LSILLPFPTPWVDEKVFYEKWDKIDWILLAAWGRVVPDTKPVFGEPGTWLERAKCAFCKNQSELIIFVQNFVPKYVQNFVPKYVYPHTRVLYERTKKSGTKKKYEDSSSERRFFVFIFRPDEDSSSLFFVRTKILRLYFSPRQRFFVFIFRSQSSLFLRSFIQEGIEYFFHKNSEIWVELMIL